MECGTAGRFGSSPPIFLCGPMFPPRPQMSFFVSCAIALACALGLGCASTAPSQSSYHFFTPPEPGRDPWYKKVAHWQEREREDLPGATLADPTAVRQAGPYSGLLRVTMGRWESHQRLALAKQLAEWAQGESRRHYRFDPITSQADDPWPTTKDLLDTNGDDCDGLDLIAYKLLREFGFPPDRLFRTIVRRDRDGANHMVTLWFEDRDDPWVIDAIGAVSGKVRRFSDLPGWTPTKVFNEREQYTPTQLHRLNAVARASAPQDRTATQD
jgi:hypothetical protein